MSAFLMTALELAILAVAYVCLVEGVQMARVSQAVHALRSTLQEYLMTILGKVCSTRPLNSREE